MADEQDKPEIVTRTSPMTGEELKFRVMPGGSLRRLGKDEETASKHKRSVKYAAHDPSYYANGEFKFQEHMSKKAECIEDLGCDEAKARWHRYVDFTDAKGVRRHGPAPFESASERNEYMRLFGFREREKGESGPASGKEIIAERFKKKRANRRNSKEFARVRNALSVSSSDEKRKLHDWLNHQIKMRKFYAEHPDLLEQATRRAVKGAP